MLGVKRFCLIAGLAVLGLAPAIAARGDAAPSAQDKQFLESIHQVNLMEITVGDLAEQRGADQVVQTLGARFVTDHAQLDQAVQGAASAAGVTLPDAPTTDQQVVRDRLRNLTGGEFDKQWVSTQLAGHVAAMQVVQAELTQGSDPAVKQVAKDAAPVLQAHHDALVAAAKKLGVPVPAGPTGTPSPSAPAGGSGSPGSPGVPGGPGPSGSSGTPGPSITSDLPMPSAS